MQNRIRRRSDVMQMMIEPQTPEYKPRHMRPTTIEVQGLEGLRKLVDQLPDGMILSVNLEEVTDGHEDS